MTETRDDQWTDARGTVWRLDRRVGDLAFWRSATEIVVTGDPNEVSDHSCDAMACGSEHVLERQVLARKPAP